MHKDAKSIISHEELLFTLAVAIGKHTQARNSDKALVAAFMLAELVTAEDIERSKAMAKKSLELCSCDRCKELLAIIAQQESKQETGESFAV